MSKSDKPSVELTPSKIRRDPPPRAGKTLVEYAREREGEGWAVAIGILAFALSITFLILWVSDYTSH